MKVKKMLRIKKVRPLPNHKVYITFENGIEKECDLSPFLEYGAFRELKEDALFNQVRNATFSIEWPNELDLSSDTLMSL